MPSLDRKLPAPELASAERAALERTVLALTEAPYVPRPEYDGADHWPPDGGRSSGTAESRERLARTAERRVWAAEDAAQAALAGAVGAYVRALRAAGMRSRGVLAAVASAVRGSAAPRISVGALDGIARDAEQYGVEAYFAPR
jgi:hypothetical protein